MKSSKAFHVSDMRRNYSRDCYCQSIDNKDFSNCLCLWGCFRIDSSDPKLERKFHDGQQEFLSKDCFFAVIFKISNFDWDTSSKVIVLQTE